LGLRSQTGIHTGSPKQGYERCFHVFHYGHAAYLRLVFYSGRERQYGFGDGKKTA
jgi:hypothetical protein